METHDLYRKKEECCGCEICVNECPQKIIEMKSDEEGFFYPHIFNSAKCINCKKCLMSCPFKKIQDEYSEFDGYYAGSLKTNETKTCASGGAATAISKKFVEKGGIVYGVAYEEKFNNIKYERAVDGATIEKFKGSKYAQARKNEVYNQIKLDLKNNKEVLFIGLPCEVSALKKATRGISQNLYTIELVCHGPTSLKVHKEYCEGLKKRYSSEIGEFSVRYKKDGKWKPYYVRAKMKNGTEHIEKFHESDYGIAFRYLKRPSCNVCSIKTPYLYGDIMLGDYHAASLGMPCFNPQGVSVLLPHSLKGKRLLDMLDNEFEMCEISQHSALLNQAIKMAIPKRSYRNGFSKVFQKFGLYRATHRPEVVLVDTLEKTKQRIMGVGSKVKKTILRKVKNENKTGN